MRRSPRATISSRSKPRPFARRTYSVGCSSKTAITPGSPARTPVAMNCAASTDLPVPDGPLTSTESPAGMPPPIRSSRPSTPLEMRVRGSARLDASGRHLQAREELEPVLGDAEGVQPRHRRLAAALDDLNLADDGVAVDVLGEPEDAVGHGEDRVVIEGDGILADQEGRRLPTGQADGEPLHETLQGRVRSSADPALRRMVWNESTTTIAGLISSTCPIMRASTASRSPFRAISLRSTKWTLFAHLGGVEEVHLLLVAQHLDRRLAEHGEVEGGPLRGGVREHDLMRQRGLARPRRAGDQVEGVLGQPAAEDFIEAGDAGG